LAWSIDWWPGQASSGASALFTFFLNGPYNSGIIGLFVVYWIFFLGTLLASTILPGAYGGVIASVVSVPGTAVAGVINIIIALVVSLVLLWVTFKAVLTLIKTFVNIILLVIAAPLIILFGSISNSGGGISGWAKNLAANLAVYPVTAVLFLVSLLFLNAAYSSTTVGQATSAPWFSNLMDGIVSAGSGISVNAGITPASTWTPPMTFGTGAGIVWLWLFASLGTITLIPKVAEIVKSIIAGKPFSYGSAIGEQVSPVAYGQGQKYGQQWKTSYDTARAAGQSPTVGQAALNKAASAFEVLSGGKIKYK